MEQWVSCIPRIVDTGKYTKAYIYKDGAFRRVKAYVYGDKQKILAIADNAIVDKAVAN